MNSELKEKPNPYRTKEQPPNQDILGLVASSLSKLITQRSLHKAAFIFFTTLALTGCSLPGYSNDATPQPSAGDPDITLEVEPESIVSVTPENKAVTATPVKPSTPITTPETAPTTQAPNTAAEPSTETTQLSGPEREQQKRDQAAITLNQKYGIDLKLTSDTTKGFPLVKNIPADEYGTLEVEVDAIAEMITKIKEGQGSLTIVHADGANLRHDGTPVWDKGFTITPTNDGNHKITFYGQVDPQLLKTIIRKIS